MKLSSKSQAAVMRVGLLLLGGTLAADEVVYIYHGCAAVLGRTTLLRAAVGDVHDCTQLCTNYGWACRAVEFAGTRLNRELAHPRGTCMLKNVSDVRHANVCSGALRRRFGNLDLYVKVPAAKVAVPSTAPVAPPAPAAPPPGVVCPGGSEPFRTSLEPRVWLCLRTWQNMSSHDSFLDEFVKDVGYWLDCETMLYTAACLGTLPLSSAVGLPHLGSRNHPMLAKPLWTERAMVLDLGASIGTCATRSASLGVHVMAVEPHPEAVKRLRAAVKLNNMSEADLNVVEVAVSDEREPGASTEVEIFGSENDSLVAYTGKLDFFSSREGPSLGKVPSMTLSQLLDDVVHSGRTVGLLKIDVEGAEFDVLRSSGESNGTYKSKLADMANLIFLDVHGLSLSARGESVAALQAWLLERGYIILEMDGVHLICVHERMWLDRDVTALLSFLEECSFTPSRELHRRSRAHWKKRKEVTR